LGEATTGLHAWVRPFRAARVVIEPFPKLARNGRTPGRGFVAAIGGIVKAKNAILIVLALSFCAMAPTAEAKRRDKGQTAKEPAKEFVDVFWSMRSPYCYISLDRVLAKYQGLINANQSL